jgi:hypothetical protein
VKIGFYSFYAYANNNAMFLNSNAPIGDNLLYPLFYLGSFLMSKGHNVSTIDTDDVGAYDLIIFLDLPELNDSLFKRAIKSKIDLYLILLESPMIRPENWEVRNHIYFKKILTWNNKNIDNIRYKHYFLPVKLQSFAFSNKQKFCVMIASNKFHSNDKRELYTARREVIRWYEEFRPSDFELYGYGWEVGSPSKFLEYVLCNISVVNKIYSKLLESRTFKSILRKVQKPYRLYYGSVSAKHSVLLQFKFAYCYENAKDINCYITEKIFDCFYAGVVPIYFGAPDISNYIPSTTFINRSDFNSLMELHRYLERMDTGLYLSYISSIKSFLESEKCRVFGAEYFASLVHDTFIVNGNPAISSLD